MGYHGIDPRGSQATKPTLSRLMRLRVSTDFQALRAWDGPKTRSVRFVLGGLQIINYKHL